MGQVCLRSRTRLSDFPLEICFYSALQVLFINFFLFPFTYIHQSNSPPHLPHTTSSSSSSPLPVPTPSPPIININPPALSHSLPTHHNGHKPATRTPHRANNPIARLQNRQIQQVAPADQLPQPHDMVRNSSPPSFLRGRNDSPEGAEQGGVKAAIPPGVFVHVFYVC